MASKPKLVELCVFTILPAESLAEMYEVRSGEFKERRPWVTAKDEFDRAAEAGKQVAIMFATAEDNATIRYWGLIKAIKIRKDARGRTTRVAFEAMKRFNRPWMATTTLELVKIREKISEDAIRPYQLIKNPGYLVY